MVMRRLLLETGWILLPLIPIGSIAVLAAERAATERIQSRAFPCVFQAWSPADNLPGEPKQTTIARHDLIWHAPRFFGLQWNNSFHGLGDGFTPGSIQQAREFRRTLLDLNPNIVLIAEIRYRDAHQQYLPESHEWWLRDEQGRIVPGWKEGSFLCLDFHNPDFRAQVAKQAAAAVATGVVDGVMLDWWSDDDSRLALIRDVRAAVGEDTIIVANANDRKTPRTAPFINGYFMECYRSKTAEDWRRIEDTLAWAEGNLRPPRVNCVETWYHESREDLNLMRATTTLALTRSNGYCLFSDPNPLPSGDHRHNWYPVWDKTLGPPVADGQKRSDGSWWREFENGTVVYNPMGNGPVSVTFSRPHSSVATGETATEYLLPSLDGGIYLKRGSMRREVEEE